MVEVERMREVLLAHGFNPILALHTVSATLTENPVLVGGTKHYRMGNFRPGGQKTSFIV